MVRTESQGKKVVRKRTRVELPRPLHINLVRSIENDLSLFTPTSAQLVKSFRQEAQKFRSGRIGLEGVKLRPKFKAATIASGEKLIADGRLVDMRLLFDERLRAVDQDSSGFAQACEFQEPQMPWAVFRGISDYGAPGKKDKVQQAAALVAACAAVMFLKRHFRLDHR